MHGLVRGRYTQSHSAGYNGADADGGAHWRHLTNTTEPPVCGGDAVTPVTMQFCVSF